jgi:crotonobetainyl-CoA:carnitine CoA-transferase CaiB-like acyl-CoA transferase
MLHGVRVIELGVWVAGPAAGGLMADWGADVIKVEPPTGDPQRTVFAAIGLDVEGACPPFEIDNRGKRSVVIDLRSSEGKSQMLALLDGADVFITNLRMDALARLGLDHETIRARCPRLIYGLLTGYGTDGPDAGRPGYDIGAFWARSGLAHTMVPPTELPIALRSGMGDHTTGLSLTAGICAALFERERTGEGRLVSTSLLRAGMYTLGWDIGIVLRFGRRERTKPRSETRAPLVSCYRAGDEKAFWLLALEGDRHWPGVVKALDAPELLADPRFVDARARLENTTVLIELLDGLFAAHAMAHWQERFDQFDVWWAPINSIADVIADPQAIASGAFVSMTPREGEAPYQAVAGPVDFSNWTHNPGPVPALGEHTAEVLHTLASHR